MCAGEGTGSSAARAGQAGAERHHAAAQRFGSRGFHEEMRVVALDRVVDEPKVAALRAAAPGFLNGSHDALLTQ